MKKASRSGTTDKSTNEFDDWIETSYEPDCALVLQYTYSLNIMQRQKHVLGNTVEESVDRLNGITLRQNDSNEHVRMESIKMLRSRSETSIDGCSSTEIPKIPATMIQAPHSNVDWR